MAQTARHTGRCGTYGVYIAPNGFKLHHSVILTPMHHRSTVHTPGALRSIPVNRKTNKEEFNSEDHRSLMVGVGWGRALH